MSGVVRVEKIWRCGGCGHECPVGPLGSGGFKPQYEGALTHACADGVVGIMHLVERERVYASEAERRLIDTFESSDWGLLAQAARYYNENRRRVARGRGAEVYEAMHAVFSRLSSLERACSAMERYAPADSDSEGRIGREFPDAVRAGAEALQLADLGLPVEELDTVARIVLDAVQSEPVR